MSVQTQAIKRPVHRVPAIIAFVLAGVFVVVGLLGAPAFYAFAAFSGFCGLIWMLGGGGQSPDDTPVFSGGYDVASQRAFGPRSNLD